MKKVLLIAIVLIASISLNTLNAQVKGGFKMGVDFSNSKWSNDEFTLNDSINSKRLISPRMGFILEIPINDNLFVQTGVFGSLRGYRAKGEDEIDGKVYESKLYQIMFYIDIPIYFGYKYDLGGAKLFAMAGPMISYGTYATMLFRVEDEEWDNWHQSVGNEETDDFKPLDIGVIIEGGVEVDRFQFTAFFSQGLSNLSNFEGSVIKNNVFGLTAAVKFGKVDGGGGYGYRR